MESQAFRADHGPLLQHQGHPLGQQFGGNVSTTAARADATGHHADPALGGVQVDTNARKPAKPRIRNRKKTNDAADGEENKRRCVSTACSACRKRKSKCDGNTPACAACASVYGTECIYDPLSDHRRKGVYKKDIDNLKTRNSTLQTLVQAILNWPEPEVLDLVKRIRTCESLDEVAESVIARDNGLEEEDDELLDLGKNVPVAGPTFESQLAGKMGELRLEDGSARFIGGTSNLIYLGNGADGELSHPTATGADQYQQQDNPVTTWTRVTDDADLIQHCLNMYFTWHYTYFTTLSKSLFYRDFLLGKPPPGTRRKTEYCTELLVNAMCALGCHFTANPAAREDPHDSATAGDHFFKEAKRLIMENDEHEKPKLTTVQAFALMSVREAGCGREAKGWVYSGMSFRMACDLGLNLDSGALTSNRDSSPDEAEEDARRITFWGCFLFDKCWSNYLGRLPQLPSTIISVPKFDVFPMEDADIWQPYTDSGFSQAHAQPSRTRAVARQISTLCEISNDLLTYFYNPLDMDKAKGKQQELKRLSEIHTRLEAWRRDLPKELEPKEGQLASVLVMHMFFQLLYIHLFRPFLKYTQATSPLPAHVSPRKLCTHAAGSISKLLRLYKRSHGLRQICNIAVYIAHSACTIHLLNLPEKNARRDIIHGVKQLEEIAESWLCARRTLGILNILARKWKVDLPEEAAQVLARTEQKFGPYTGDAASPKSVNAHSPAHSAASHSAMQQAMRQSNSPSFGPVNNVGYFGSPASIANHTMASPAHTPSPEAQALAAASRPPRTTGDLHFMTARNAGLSGIADNMSTVSMSPAMRPLQRHSTDSGINTSEASPSNLFEVEQPVMRESQDWWMRDQAQLAMGFDNWNMADSDPFYLANNGTNTPGTLSNGTINMQAGLNGGTQGLAVMPNGNGVNRGLQRIQSGQQVMNNMNGIGNWLNSYTGISYNEEEWYQ